MWHRVFGLTAAAPSPAGLVEAVRAVGVPAIPHFKGDDLGWTSGELVLPGGGSPVALARYLTDEDDLRDDLNAHAAELETMDYSPNSAPLMERVIRTKQLVTVRRPLDHANEAALDTTIEACLRYLAGACDGVYQSDGRGWFTPSGELLVREY